jgi:hypothetical protein
VRVFDPNGLDGGGSVYFITRYTSTVGQRGERALMGARLIDGTRVCKGQWGRRNSDGSGTDAISGLGNMVDDSKGIYARIQFPTLDNCRRATNIQWSEVL